MRQSTLNYLRKRYLELEKEIADAAIHVTDLKYRKAIIADEIKHYHRVLHRFSKLSQGAGPTH